VAEDLLADLEQGRQWGDAADQRRHHPAAQQFEVAVPGALLPHLEEVVASEVVLSL
jgi:hypothetical protein